MDWDYIVKYLPLFEKATLLTLRIGCIGIIMAIIVGLICAVIQYYTFPVIRRVVGVYIELNTPILV